MISPDFAPIFVVFVLVFIFGSLAGLVKGQNPWAEPQLSSDERRRKKRKERKETLVGCAVLFALGSTCMFGSVIYNVFIVGVPPPAPQGQDKAAAPAPVVVRPTYRPAPRPAQLPPSRPAHLRGGMTDGCSLLTPEDTAEVLGRPLAYDTFALLDSRDESIHCAYVDRPVRRPQRPRQEVSLQVERIAPWSSRWGSPVPSAPDLDWRQHDAGEGVSVAMATAHELRLVVRVALRQPKRLPQKRMEAERDAALLLVLLAHGRALSMDVDALTAVPMPTLASPPELPGFLRSLKDVVYERDSPPERFQLATLESLYALRARFGTRVKVIVLTGTSKPRDFSTEALASAVEEAFEVGRADKSPRRDGALVVIDTAVRRARIFLGPGAPELTQANRRPLPLEWQGQDLTTEGPGIAKRLSGLAAAYTRAYQRLGISGPPDA